MKALLDTNSFLWSALDDPRLSGRARGVVWDEGNALFLSPASAWEIVIKLHTGKLKLPASPGHFLPECMSQFAFEALPIKMKHVLHVETLPMHHKDPFGRILIAQSLVENLPILTSDPIIAKYGVEIIW